MFREAAVCAVETFVQSGNVVALGCGEVVGCRFKSGTVLKLTFPRSVQLGIWVVLAELLYILNE